MTHDFDKDYWDEHWQGKQRGNAANVDASLPNPYLAPETAGLAPGTALDAGCGEGAEAIWLTGHGWTVVGADISTEALVRAAEHGSAAGVGDRVTWVQADLSTWSPDGTFDLVMTHYAHPAIPQLEFYDRIAEWVSPGGTLLIVGHRHTGSTGHGHHPPETASAGVDAITARLGTSWEIVTAHEQDRRGHGHDGPGGVLHDFVVRATRRS